MQKAQKYILWLALALAGFLILSLIFDWSQFIAPVSVAVAIGLAFGIGSVDSLKSYQYTAWIMAAIACGMMYPDRFLHIGEFDLRNKWLILIVVQVVMFGMGTQMSLKDFTGIKTMGKGVLVGILCQFTIMPVTGYLLTRFFDFEPEIAAGVILIGSCSSGLASNVMVFIARANLTLSVTLTAVATLLAPIMTPFLMKMLAGTYVEIDFFSMCVQIVKIVIVPIGSAMLYDAYKNGNESIRKSINYACIAAVLWLLNTILFWDRWDSMILSETGMLLLELGNFICGSIIVGVAYYHANKVLPEIHGFMPKLSMFGIVYFTTVTTAASRENILTIGVFLLIVSVLHNALGYTFGYGISRLLGLDKDSCRTVALEVGLQNGGMASGLAGVMGKLATLGLASAVFSPWMNISGSLLANYWRRKSTLDQSEVGEANNNS